MQAVRLVLAGVVALAVAVPAFAQRVEIQIQPNQPGHIAVQNAGPLLAPAALDRLKFTDEQKEKYNKIDSDYRDNAKKTLDAHRTAVATLNDREKIKEANDKLQKDSKQNREDSLAKVEKVLTDDQKTVFAQVKNQAGGGVGGLRPVQLPGAGIGQILPLGTQTRLQLTEEQKKKIEEIQKEAEAKVMKVLSDEQKKQLENLKRPIVRPLPAPINPRPIQIQPNPAQPRILPINPAKD